MGLEDAEDLIELGIEGIDTLVEKHFHKVPDKLVDPKTYTDKVKNKLHRKKRGSESENDREHDHGRRRESGHEERRGSGNFDDSGRDRARDDERMRRRDDEIVRAEDPVRRKDRDWERGALTGAAAGAGAGYGAASGYDYNQTYSPDPNSRSRDLPRGQGQGQPREPEFYPKPSRRTQSPPPLDPWDSNSGYGLYTRSPPPQVASPSYSSLNASSPQGFSYMVPPVPPAAAVYNYNSPNQEPRYVDGKWGEKDGVVRDRSGYNYLPPREVQRRGSSLPPVEDRERRRSSGDWDRDRGRDAGKERGGRRKSEDRDRGRGGSGGGGGGGGGRRGGNGDKDRDNGQSTTEKVVMTLLGAAVGGLAVSAVMDRMDKKEREKDGKGRDRDDRDDRDNRVGGIKTSGRVGGGKGRR